MAGACMALLLFAPSFADLVIESTYGYDDLEQSRTGMDYWFGLRQGGSGTGSLLNEMPRYKGLTADAYHELAENPNLSVHYAAITNMSSADIVLLPGETQVDSVNQLIEQRSSFCGMNPENSAHMEQLGFPAGSDLLLYSVIGMPHEQLEQMANARQSGALDSAQTMSFMTFYRDFTILNQEKADVSLEVRLPYIAMIAVFAITIFIALLISMDLKAKSSAQSLLLMRAVGLDRKKLSRLLLLSNVLPCLEGAAGGIILGGGSGLFVIMMYGMSAGTLLMRTLLPNLIAGLVLLLLMAVISYLRPRNWILDQPIVSSIDNTRF